MALSSEQSQIRWQRWIIALLFLCVALMAGAFFGRATDPAAPPPTRTPSPSTPAETQLQASTVAATPDPPPPDPNGTMAEWLFEKANAGLIPDASGHGYDARIVAPAQLTPTWGGHKALVFDGSGDNGVWQGQPQNCGLRIEKPLARAFQQLSIEAWVCKDPGPWMPVLYRGSWDNPSGFGLYMEWSAGKAAFGHYGSNGVGSEHVVQDGQWHYIVGTIAPTGDNQFVYAIYVDGELDAQQKGTVGVTEASGDGARLMVGCPNMSGADNPYKGNIGRVALFDVALSPETIKKRFELQRPPRPTGAVLTQ